MQTMCNNHYNVMLYFKCYKELWLTCTNYYSECASSRILYSWGLLNRGYHKCILWYSNKWYIYIYFLAYTHWIHFLLAFWYQNFRQIFFYFTYKYIFSVIYQSKICQWKNFFKITSLTPIKKNSGTTVAICFLNFLVFIFLW